MTISRCLYIGLTIEDRDILLRAYEYLEDLPKGTALEKFRSTNERIIPCNTAAFCNMIEAVKPYNERCDGTYDEWIPLCLDEAMLRHYGRRVYDHGYFRNNCPAKLPDDFSDSKTRRRLYSFHNINQFHGPAPYLADSAEWLMWNRNSDGLWDRGTQIKDPWGYFGYFSTNRNYQHNRITDCTIEILNFLKKHIDGNTV